MTTDPLAALRDIVDDAQWSEYEDHLVAGTNPTLVLDYIRRDLRAALAASPPAIDPERLAEVRHWLMHPDRAYAPHELAVEADGRLAALIDRSEP